MASASPALCQQFLSNELGARLCRCWNGGKPSQAFNPHSSKGCLGMTIGACHTIKKESGTVLKSTGQHHLDCSLNANIEITLLTRMERPIPMPIYHLLLFDPSTPPEGTFIKSTCRTRNPDAPRRQTTMFKASNANVCVKGCNICHQRMFSCQVLQLTSLAYIWASRFMVYAINTYFDVKVGKHKRCGASNCICRAAYLFG